MKDLHSHLLPGIDDGVKTIGESLKVLRKLQKAGFTDVVLTPHYCDFYKTDNLEKNKIFNYLKEQLLINDIDINIHLGNEILIRSNIKELLNTEIMPINSKYLLIEFSFNNYFDGYEIIIDDLIREGYTIIIAHPERYLYFQNNVNKVRELTLKGVLFQSNYGSIIKHYGTKAYKCLKQLLKLNLINFLGTDIHRDSVIVNEFENIKTKFIKIIGSEKFELLSNKNIEDILKPID